MKRVTNAIDRAKGFWSLEEGEQPIPRDKVHLRELVIALNDLAEPKVDDLDQEHSLVIFEDVLSALIEQQIIAETLEDKAIIPKSIWMAERAVRLDAFHSKFWAGEINFLRHDKPFAGKTPVVPRHKAEAWITAYVNSRRSSGRPRILNVEQVYRTLYPDGHEAVGDSWKMVARQVSEKLGGDVSVDTIRRRLGRRK
ncbi:hypothetical protein [Marimonas lutisalis]|uniref:hypothetical protein n=1 Tax=Marimonas lutisalis TaxID=2545756 RepID=UPI0010F9B912|nr:hypothetical protein [Marimonas lutisalis]